VLCYFSFFWVFVFCLFCFWVFVFYFFSKGFCSSSSCVLFLFTSQPISFLLFWDFFLLGLFLRRYSPTDQARSVLPALFSFFFLSFFEKGDFEILRQSQFLAFSSFIGSLSWVLGFSWAWPLGGVASPSKSTNQECISFKFSFFFGSSFYFCLMLENLFFFIWVLVFFSLGLVKVRTRYSV